MSELAIVSARPARLRVACEEGSKGAEVALRLANDPGKFLSSVQIGITLVGIVAGAFSGSRLGTPLAERLEWLGLPARYADDGGLHAGDRRDDLSQRGGRRTGAQAARAALGRADRDPRLAADGGGRDGDRAVRLAARSLVDPAAAADAAEPSRRPGGDRRGTPHDLRRGDPLGRDRGRRARDHERHHAARRASGARGDDAADRARLHRTPRRRSRDPRRHRRQPAQPDAGGGWLDRQDRRRGEGQGRPGGAAQGPQGPAVPADEEAARSSPTSSTRWTRCACSSRPKWRWHWSTTNTATSKAW